MKYACVDEFKNLYHKERGREGVRRERGRGGEGRGEGGERGERGTYIYKGFILRNPPKHCAV